MAVYTKVSDTQLAHFLSAYDVGMPRTFKGIAEGVENSNFYLETDRDRFILTLYEKRVNADELPFFLSLMQYLVAAGLPTAAPIADRKGETLKALNGRPAALIQFVTGVSKDAPDEEDCAALGMMLARLHKATAGFGGNRKNNLSVEGWKALVARCAGRADECADGLDTFINEEVAALARAWPAGDALPRGVIHADLFPDNVLFTGHEITGIIDFYFACTDFYAYDLSVCLNSWCFDARRKFIPGHARAMINAYEAERRLSDVEKKSLPLLARGASLRFLLTRLYDWLNQEPNALVTVKDPLEYAEKSRFFRSDELRELLHDKNS
ncbi:homoserine kinase [Aquisalinus flavus]|uniref:Homoserine kinase n=1 Tax=Aquisalinus flavus TaxID=1526572 RepID=A0A8J2Y5A1_9PROT|nr:homoserine kinase [Aquisalinus flavus]MBD0426114.1 homoserine kinase [Aquisalinus flavus]UNE48301.1 homoserine kinase [Aquisalinus flavus]GGD10529.1 homoserine kinase [Aquisalinus flavus]